MALGTPEFETPEPESEIFDGEVEGEFVETEAVTLTAVDATPCIEFELLLTILTSVGFFNIFILLHGFQFKVA